MAEMSGWLLKRHITHYFEERLAYLQAFLMPKIAATWREF